MELIISGSMSDNPPPLVPRGYEKHAHSVFRDRLKPKKETQQQQQQSIMMMVTNQQKAKVDGEKEGESDCPICLGSFRNPVSIVACGHTFCEGCILFWLGKSSKCALCKGPAKELVERKIGENAMTES